MNSLIKSLWDFLGIFPRLLFDPQRAISELVQSGLIYLVVIIPFGIFLMAVEKIENWWITRTSQKKYMKEHPGWHPPTEKEQEEYLAKLERQKEK